MDASIGPYILIGTTLVILFLASVLLAVFQWMLKEREYASAITLVGFAVMTIYLTYWWVAHGKEFFAWM